MFSWGEPVEFGVDGFGHIGGEGVDDEAGESGGEHGVTFGDSPDGVDEVGPADRFGDVPPGAGTDDGDHVVGSVRDRECEERGLDVSGRDGLDDVGTGARGQMHVEEDHIGRTVTDHVDGFDHITGLTDHIHVVAELGANAGSDEIVIVDEDDRGLEGHDAVS